MAKRLCIGEHIFEALRNVNVLDDFPKAFLVQTIASLLRQYYYPAYVKLLAKPSLHATVFEAGTSYCH